MSKLPAFALVDVPAAALAGTAVSAKPHTPVMNVSLPDGSVARVEYVGDVAPRLTIDPGGPFPAVMGDWGPMASFAGFDRMIEQMNREAEAMLRQAKQMSRLPASERQRNMSRHSGMHPPAPAPVRRSCRTATAIRPVCG